ncbi:MAG TPA: hypothetical protein VLG25_02620, partial [Patescibacteria group bacterium]|nr:hypothetical protein [Patescibacteria group bacterium]
MTQYQTDQIQQLVSDHNSEIAHVSNFRRLVACGVAAMMSLGIAGVESPDASAATITDRIAGADRYGTAEA